MKHLLIGLACLWASGVSAQYENLRIRDSLASRSHQWDSLATLYYDSGKAGMSNVKLSAAYLRKSVMSEDSARWYLVWAEQHNTDAARELLEMEAFRLHWGLSPDSSRYKRIDSLYQGCKKRWGEHLRAMYH
jgi:hypothetical protein